MANEPAPPPGLAPAKHVPIGNRLTTTVGGFLSARTSRRGFLVRSALVGSAFAVAGCSFGTKKGPAFQRLTDCAPNSVCRGDGYTEFCCSINGGHNTCPGDSIPAGWWVAGSSHWCHNGPRWYVDCNQVSGTPDCRCGPSCDNRRVYCNHFRYGQCNSHVAVGVIACRLSFCESPQSSAAAQLSALGCNPHDGRVDNSTAGHITGCLLTGPPAPPPPPTTKKPPPPPPSSTRPPPPPPSSTSPPPPPPSSTSPPPP